VLVRHFSICVVLSVVRVVLKKSGRMWTAVCRGNTMADYEVMGEQVPPCICYFLTVGSKFMLAANVLGTKCTVCNFCCGFFVSVFLSHGVTAVSACKCVCLSVCLSVLNIVLVTVTVNC